MSDILSGSSQQVLQLDGADLLDDGAFLTDTSMEPFFELVQLALLLVEVLDEAAAAFLHLVKPPLEPYPVGGLVPLPVLDLVVGHWVLRMPNVVRDELFNLIFLSFLFLFWSDA